MSEIVDKILSDVEKEDEILYWTPDRIAETLVVPVSKGYWSEVSTVLDKIPLSLRFTYNDKNQGYFVDIKSADGSIDTKGHRVNSSSDILDGLALSELGRLFAVDLQMQDSDPTYEDFGTRFELFYLPKAFK
jgi:hypothetical protein